MHKHDRKGFYHLLDGTPNSTTRHLKRNYRRLALQHHPDLQTEAAARLVSHDRMRRLNEAYEILRDPESRARYDEECGFPRCRRHPKAFLDGHCFRCREPICPDCQDGDDGACLECLEKTRRRLSTRDPVERALLALEEGALGDAEEDLATALFRNPRDVVALTALSTVREKRGDWRGAIAALSLALEVKPGHALSHFRLGKLYASIGDRGRAESEIREAIRIDPGSGKFRAGLSMLPQVEAQRETSSFRPMDRVTHQVFGSGVVAEVTSGGVKVEFAEAGVRWLDPTRAPMVRLAH